jgi:CubicO group peptidase (beta-lactamase class C family)
MAPLLPTTARTLLARTARAQAEGRAPSLVAGVVRDGGLVWSAGRGAVEEPHRDVQYRLGSISKTVTAITVLRLRDEGRLDLDDPLEKHLPGTPLGDRTIGQLLSHLAGAGAESPGQWWERTPGTTLDELGLSDADVVLPAARRFHYSNLGFGVLGELVATARGRAWVEVARDEVLAPLGMGRTTPRPSGRAAQGYAVHPSAPVWMAYGLGVQVQRPAGAPPGTVLVGHGGSMPGFLAGLWVDRAEAAGALTLANTTTGLDNGLAAGLLADLRAAEPRIVDAWAPSPSPVPVELLGPWFWGPAPYVLRAIPGGLLHLGGLGRPGRSSRFRPGPDGTWIGMDGYFAGERLRLDPAALNLATFVFTRVPYDPAAPVPGGVTDWA